MPQDAALDGLGRKLQDRTAVIGVVGMGYVGLPLILRVAEAGYPVVGLDINDALVATLRRGASPFTHIPDSRIALLNRPGAQITSDFAAVRAVDAVLICLPTPLDRHRQPDLSYVTGCMTTIRDALHPGMLVSLESTTWPGTTEEVLQPIIEGAGLAVGRDVALVFSPEREDPGNARFSIQQIPKVLGGVTPRCRQIGEMLYGSIVDRVVPVSSTRAAELTKLLENIQRSVNIGLMNEMKMVADRMGIDIFEVIDAAATKPFGFTPYYPGPGLGGHCIPIDPFYLTWKAREYGLHTRFIELSGEINGAMPRYVVEGLSRRLSEVAGTALRGARILVVGLAYKKNVNDIRESPALEILSLLREARAEVAYHDPLVPEIPATRRYRHLMGLRSVPVAADTAEPVYDAAVVVTDHDAIDYATVLDRSGIVIDTRNVYGSTYPGAAGRVFPS